MSFVLSGFEFRSHDHACVNNAKVQMKGFFSTDLHLIAHNIDCFSENEL